MAYEDDINYQSPGFHPAQWVSYYRHPDLNMTLSLYVEMLDSWCWFICYPSNLLSSGRGKLIAYGGGETFAEACDNCLSAAKALTPNDLPTV